MDINEILKQVTLARAVFFTPSDSLLTTHRIGDGFSRQQLDGISLIAQETYRTTTGEDLGINDLSYLTTHSYRVFFRWIEYGMLGFIFDVSTSLPILLDLINATAEKLEDVYAVELAAKREKDELIEKYESIQTIAEETLGSLGPELIKTVITDLKLDPNSPTIDDLENFVEALQRAARMIIGPSRATDMSKKMKTLLNN